MPASLCRICGALPGEEPHTADCPDNDERDLIRLVVCPACDGESCFLGTMAQLAYFKCRDCALTFYGHIAGGKL